MNLKRLCVAIVLFVAGSALWLYFVDTGYYRGMYGIYSFITPVITYCLIGFVLHGKEYVSEQDSARLPLICAICSALLIIIQVVPFFVRFAFTKFLMNSRSIILLSLILGASISELIYRKKPEVSDDK